MIEGRVSQRERRSAAGAVDGAQFQPAGARHVVGAGEREDVRTIHAGRPVFLIQVELVEELIIGDVGLTGGDIAPPTREGVRKPPLNPSD